MNLIELEDFKKILNFINLAENLKIEKRNTRVSTGEHESVAAHSWRVALLVMILGENLDQEINLEKALKMALIHDISEAIVGDLNYAEYEKSAKLVKTRSENEKEAIIKIKQMLPENLGDEISDLWNEFENSQSLEAKFVQAIDKIEAQIQDNEMDLKYWTEYEILSSAKRLCKYCNYDTNLKNFKNLIQKQSKEKINISPFVKNSLSSEN